MNRLQNKLLENLTHFLKSKLKDRKNIEDFEWSDIEIIDYQCHPKISADMVA